MGCLIAALLLCVKFFRFIIIGEALRGPGL